MAVVRKCHLLTTAVIRKYRSPTTAIVRKYRSLMMAFVRKYYSPMTAIIGNRYADKITGIYLWWCLIVGIFLPGCKNHPQVKFFLHKAHPVYTCLQVLHP
jgi:hypothetical protein